MLRGKLRSDVLLRRAVRARRLASEKNMTEDNDNHWVDNFRQTFQIKSMLLKNQMTRIRCLSINIPFIKKYTIPFCISDLAGHASFMLLALSYLESDFLNLRLYAASGVTFSILFQYYREKPLWIPIRWNSLFLLINGVMIGLLLKDASDANNIPEEQKFLYTTVFQSKGMTSVDFMHLISSAKRIEHKKGDKLVTESKKNTRVCLVKKGKLIVLRGGEKVGTINQYQFVGAMSFLTWASKIDAEENARDVPPETPAAPATVGSMIGLETLGSSIETLGTGIQHWLDGDKQQQQQSEARDLSAASSATIPSNHPIDMMDHNFSSDEMSTFGRNPLPVPGPPPENITAAISTAQAEGQSGWADVVCEEDCVVFSWKFRDLYELVRENPQMGMVLERCISEDLNKKMASSWQDEPKNRYRQLLTGALMDSNVTPHKKEMLSKSREELHISADDHLLLLHGLGWTLDEFEAGYRGAPGGDIMSRYMKLLKRCMESEEGVTEDDRTSLRRFRKANGISTQIHYSILRQLGWTTDDYEAGQLDALDVVVPPPPPPPTTPQKSSGLLSSLSSLKNVSTSIFSSPRSSSNKTSAVNDKTNGKEATSSGVVNTITKQDSDVVNQTTSVTADSSVPATDISMSTDDSNTVIKSEEDTTKTATVEPPASSDQFSYISWMYRYLTGTSTTPTSTTAVSATTADQKQLQREQGQIQGQSDIHAGTEDDEFANHYYTAAAKK